MSEKFSTAQSRLDSFDDAQRAKEQADYADAVYGEAGVTKFDDESRQLLEDQATYEAYMEKFAHDNRDSLDRHIDAVDSGEVQSNVDARARRMNMMAQHIAELKDNGGDEDVIADKEAKLEELAEAYAHNLQSSGARKAPVTSNEGLMEGKDGITSVAADEQAAVSGSVQAIEKASGPKLADLPTDEKRKRLGEIFSSKYFFEPNQMTDEEVDRYDVIDNKVAQPAVEEMEIADVQDAEILEATPETPELGAEVVEEVSPEEAAAFRQEVESPSEEVEEAVEDDASDEKAPAPEEEDWITQARKDLEAMPTKSAFGVWLDKSRVGIMNKLRSLRGRKTTEVNDANHSEQEKEFDDEQRSLRKRLIGGFAVVAAIGVGAVLIKHGMDHSWFSDGSTNPEVISGSEAPTGNVTPGGAVRESVPTPSSLMNYLTEHNVLNGEGGESLLDRNDINPQDWYSFENDAIKRFPSELYRMDDGHVGLQNPGEMSTALQQYVARFK